MTALYSFHIHSFGDHIKVGIPPIFLPAAFFSLWRDETFAAKSTV